MFEKSKLVEDLLKRNMEEPLVLYEGRERNPLEPREDQVNRAYNKICEMWNRDEKARGFIKFLIRAFIPMNQENKILDGDVRDCLLGIKVAGVKPIADAWGKIMLEGMTGKAREKAIREGTKGLPAEVKFATFGYYSNDKKCDKYISGETYVALNEFVEDMCYDDEDNEVKTLMMQKMWAEKKKSMPKKSTDEKPKVVKYQVSSMIDDETIKKLKGIK